jgi:PIN domain nuclease of toxin-antitoxin system
MPMLNLDTHILIHALRGDVRPAERKLLAGDSWGIAAIVLWEIAKLVQLGRITLDLEDPEVERTLSSIHVWPLDLAVARASTQLDFQGDPADELIAATSLVHGAPLVTRDRRMRRSKLVPLAK